MFISQIRGFHLTRSQKRGKCLSIIHCLCPAGFNHVHVVLRNQHGGDPDVSVEPARPVLEHRHSSSVSINLSRPVVRTFTSGGDPDGSDGDHEAPGKNWFVHRTGDYCIRDA